MTSRFETVRGGAYVIAFILMVGLPAAGVASNIGADSPHPMAIVQPTPAMIESMLDREIARVSNAKSLLLPREVLTKMVVDRLATVQSRTGESRDPGAAIIAAHRMVHEVMIEQRMLSRLHGTTKLSPSHPASRVDTANASTIPTDERTALIDLYNSTNGAGWTNRTNWRNAEDTDFNAPGTECTWFGVTCDGGLATVQWLNLFVNNLVGTLPASLGSLTNLQGIYLYNNQLTSSIPKELGNLNDLQYLYLFSNQLAGSIPTELGNLTNLRELLLSSNQLSGEIPKQLGNLTNLLQLWLYSNQLTGSIPAELGNLTNLRELLLSSNLLSGIIPIELGKLEKLQGLYLYSNQITGPIPTQLGSLSNLRDLYLATNQLTGSIPTELGSLIKLKSIYLYSNELSGTIPTELGNLKELMVLSIFFNHLTGPIPKQLGNLTNLQSLNLGSNLLTGSIPPELGNLTKLIHLWLHSNQLTGSIPTELGNLANLQTLLLFSNQLSGVVPSSITSLNKLIANNSDFRWNGLNSSDPAVITFLNGKQLGGDWQSTQTVPVTNLTAPSATSASVTLTWTPITYTGETGGYQVFYSTTSGGPWTLSGTTANKAAASWTVIGLDPATPYYFVVKSMTNPHANNQNTVVSDSSAEVSASTLATLAVAITGTGTGTVASDPAGINCAPTCSADFAFNTVVTLTPAASSGSVFNTWSGACTGSGPCQVTMDAVKSVTAHFKLKGTEIGFNPVTPCRVFDTRIVSGPTGGEPIGANDDQVFTVINTCGIPDTAEAIAANITVVNGAAIGNMSIIAGDITSTQTTTIEIPLIRARANNATIQLATDGAGTIRVINNSSGTVHLILDVNGYFQ